MLYIEFLKLVYRENLNNIEFNISFIKENEIYKPLEIVIYKNFVENDYITLESFFAPTTMSPYEDDNGEKYLCIASSEDNGRGGLLVGVQTSNCDNIFKYRWEESDLIPGKTKKLSNNIFEFIYELNTIQMWTEEYKRSNLYKSYCKDYYQL